MKTNYPKIVEWFLFVWVFGGLGCECISLSHTYSEMITFSPEKAQYKIGDTIWLSSKFACTGLVNLETGQTEDFCDAVGLGINMGIVWLKPDSTGFAVGSTDKFDYLNKEGEIFSDPKIQPQRIKQISFQQQNGEYSVKIGIIPLQAGQFGLFPSNSATVVQHGHHKCEDKAGFSFVLSNADKHTELYEAFLGFTVEGYERDHGYFFEVIP